MFSSNSKSSCQIHNWNTSGVLDWWCQTKYNQWVLPESKVDIPGKQILAHLTYLMHLCYFVWLANKLDNRHGVFAVDLTKMTTLWFHLSFALSLCSILPQCNNNEIRPGKHIGVCISVANNRLFVGSIPKSKTKEQIVEEFAKVTGESSSPFCFMFNFLFAK